VRRTSEHLAVDCQVSHCAVCELLVPDLVSTFGSDEIADPAEAIPPVKQSCGDDRRNQKSKNSGGRGMLVPKA
jgi:hypothetical protein